MRPTPPPDDAPPEDIADGEQAEDFAAEPVETGAESGVEFDLDGEAGAASLQRGLRAIGAHCKHAPAGPGVYRMLAEDGSVLYVGKAKSLRRRVASYTRLSGHTNRIARMIALTATMVFASTRTEVEALLLEANLIKQLKPRFNVVMRDDKSFPFILLTRDERGAQLTKHRGARSRKGDYFGPFASVWAVNRTLNALQRAFLLRSCENSFHDNRSRPCLLFQIKRCSGPCTGEVSSENYAELTREAQDFLTGKSRAVRERLAAEMNAAAEALEFERAARLRDRISALAAIQGQQGINPRGVDEADVFAAHEEAGQFCVEAVFYRACQNWGNRAYFPRADRSLPLADVLSAFVAQFYADRPAPKLVLLSHAIDEAALLASALTEQAGRKVEVLSPQRGEKSEMIADALKNAREALGRRLADSASQLKLLEALSLAFGMEKPPRRVEIYDNSHIMGTAAIGAMVVAGAQGFVKAQYRTFNIKTDLAPGDDYAMMREVLSRRFARLSKEEENVDPDAFPRMARSHPDRRRARPVRRGQRRRRRSRRGRGDGGLDRQGGGPQRGPGDVLPAGTRTVPAGAARSGALFRATPARRGASLRHRHASGQAQEGIRQKSARRDRRRRPDAQARAAPGFRHGQGRGGSGFGRSRKDARPFRRHRETGVRPFSRKSVTAGQRKEMRY